MKAYKTVKYLAFASVAGLWGCSSQQYAQNTEYDDLYFSSKDRKEVVYTASTSGNYNLGNTGVAGEDNSQKNVNPEYIQQYAQQSKKSNNSTNNATTPSGSNDSYSADNSYYDENYRRESNGGVNLARNYNRRSWDSGPNINIFPSYGFGNFYGGSAFYDPFYDPFMYGHAFYDPFFHRPFVRVRPGVIVSIGSGFGMGGWNSWNSWYDPFYAWNDPFYGRFAYGGWGDPFYGNGFNNPYRYYGGNYYGGGNVIVVNPANNAGNNDPRTVRYSPRSARGSSAVNDNFDNTPRTGRAERGGRVDQTVETNPNTTPGGRSSATISDGGDRPARAVRPRSTDSQEYYRPQNAPADYNGADGSRRSAVTGNDGVSTPRAVRPRGNSNEGSDRNYNYSDYNSNSNRTSSPSYNAPSTGRSPRSSDYNSAPRNDNWNNSRTNDTYRSSDSNSGGSYSAPSSSPRGGSGGSRSPRSPR